jgi:hypothetical protein
MNLMRQLQAFGSTPFTHGGLLPLLAEYRRPNDKIADMLAKGTLVQLRRGLYVLGTEQRSVPLSLPLVANLLFGPSYVSLEFALSWHGLIPESVVEVSSVTPLRARQHNTPVGRFSYTRLAPVLYAVGIQMAQNPDGSSFLIASPEKAVCDKVLLTRNLRANDPSTMQAYLFDDLRLDADAIAAFDLTTFRQCQATGHKPRQMAALCQVMEKMQ